MNTELNPQHTFLNETNSYTTKHLYLKQKYFYLLSIVYHKMFPLWFIMKTHRFSFQVQQTKFSFDLPATSKLNI